MSHAIEHLAKKLKSVREAKGQSQRALSKLAGVPQGHISKIENGTVDLRLSSLVALARALDLELTLVPRKTVSAVQSIVRTSERGGNKSNSLVSKEYKRLNESLARVTSIYPAIKELAQLQNRVRDLQRLSLPSSKLHVLKEANKAVKIFAENKKNIDALRLSLSNLNELRSALDHAPTSKIARPRPLYSLEEDEHG